MSVKIIMPEFEIHTTPSEEIIVDPDSITVTLDDIYERRYKITVKPFVSIKIVTIDCVSSKEYYNDFCYREGRYHRHILQADNSHDLNMLIQNSGGKQFLNNAKCFILPLQDNFVEIIADEFKLEKL